MGGMQSRTVALVVALSLATGWALGGRFSSQAPRAGTAALSRGPRPLGVETPTGTAGLSESLRLKIDRNTRSPRSSRNPFVFGSRPTVPSTSAARGSTAARPEPEARIDDRPQSGPAYELAGIASARGADGLEHTAILSGVAGVVFARVGDALPGGLTVVEVHETMVTLRDASGGERTLRLR